MSTPAAAPWQTTTIEALKANKVDTVVYVPDLVLAGLVSLAESDPAITAYSPAKEEEGVAIACGAYLGGHRAALMLQNSGVGNIVNVLASLAVPFQIPLIMLVSQRGELFEFNASQLGMASATRAVFDSLGVSHFTVDRLEDQQTTLDGSIAMAFQTERPVAIILSPLLTGGKKGL